MKTIAVVLRGHVRQWDNCKKSIFDSFDLPNTNVVFFFVTWEGSLVNLSNIEKDFVGKKLGKIEAISSNKVTDLCSKKSEGAFFESYDHITYLRQYSNMLVSEHELENQMVFDLVVNTRPDLFINADKTKVESLLSSDYTDFVIGSNFIKRAKTQEALVNLSRAITGLSNTLFVDDLIFVANSLTIGVFNSEYEFLHTADSLGYEFSPHHLVADHILSSKFLISNSAWDFFREYDICRPGIRNRYKDIGINEVRLYSLEFYAITKKAENLKIIIPVSLLNGFNEWHKVQTLLSNLNLPTSQYVFICSDKDNTLENRNLLASVMLNKSIVSFSKDSMLVDEISHLLQSSKYVDKDDSVIIVNTLDLEYFDGLSFVNAALESDDDCLVLVNEDVSIYETTPAYGVYYYKKVSDLFLAIHRMVLNISMVKNKYHLFPSLKHLVSDNRSVKFFIYQRHN